MRGLEEGELRAGGFVAAVFGDDHGDVVVLLVGGEALDFLDDGSECGLSSGLAVAEEGVDEAVFTELLAGGVGGFGDAVGIESEGVATGEAAFADGAIPIPEDAEDGGGGFEALDGAIAAKQQAGEMAAIGITQAACGVVIFAKEESGERAVRSVVAKELIDGAQETLRLIESDGALAAEIGLEIGHQESGGDAFSGDVADDKTEAAAAEIEEVIVIAADLACLNAETGVFEGFERGLRLGEEAGLDFFGDGDFLCGAAIGFEAGGKGAALGFDGVGFRVEAHERKGITVGILETGKNATPNRRLLGDGPDGVRGVGGTRVNFVFETLEAGGELKEDAALAPFAVLGDDVFCDEGDLGGLADEAVLVGAGLGSDECEIGGAVGRGDGEPAAARLRAGVEDQLETELIEVEGEALLEVADENCDRLEAQVGILTVQTNGGAV